MHFELNEENQLVYNHDFGQLVSEEYPKICIHRSTRYKLESVVMNLMQHENTVKFTLNVNDNGIIIIDIPTLKIIEIDYPFTIHFSYQIIKLILPDYEITYKLREDSTNVKYYKLTHIEYVEDQ